MACRAAAPQADASGKDATRQVNAAIRSLLGAQPPGSRRTGAKSSRAARGGAAARPSAFTSLGTRARPQVSQRHIGDLNWLAPLWVTVTGPNHQFNVLPDRNGRAIINAAQHRPLILPVVQNFDNGQVDQVGIQAMLADPRLRKQRSWTSWSHFLQPTTHRAPSLTSSNSIDLAKLIIWNCSAKLGSASQSIAGSSRSPCPSIRAWDLAALRGGCRQGLPHGL